MNRPAHLCCNMMLLGFCDSHAHQVHTACGHRIGMCGQMYVPKDGCTCSSITGSYIAEINATFFY